MGKTHEPSGAHRWARQSLIVALTALCLVAASCSSSGSSGSTTSSSDTIADEGPPVDGGSIVIGVPAETSGWNPHDNQIGQTGSLVTSAILEPLAALDANLDPVPWLATSWTPNATYDSYTIALRPGVTFQNGEPFDAAAAKLNIDDALTGTVSSTALKGLITKVTVVDSLTIQVSLSQPWAAFPNTFLASLSGMMMAPAALNSPTRGTDHPIGTGPFTFSSWKPDSALIATKNPSYWQPGLPHLDQIEFRVINETSTQSAAVKTGDVTMIFTDSAAAANTLTSGYTVIKDWTSEPSMAIVNTIPEVNGASNPLTNLHARLALAYATDRSALAAAVGQGVQTPNSPFPSTSKWGLPEDQNGYVNFDLDKAKQEVAAYEADTGATSFKITLSLATTGDNQQIAQLLQGQWSEAGITTTLDPMEITTSSIDVVFGHYQVAIFPLYSSPDPDQNYFFWAAANIHGEGTLSLNFSQFTTPQLETGITTGRESPDFATRKAAYDEVVHQINGAAVNIWTYSTPYSIIASPKVHGLSKASQVPFGNFQPKTWLGDLWLSP